MLEDAKPGDVESEVQDQLSAAKSKVVIEELVSFSLLYICYYSFNIDCFLSKNKSYICYSVI